MDETSRHHRFRGRLVSCGGDRRSDGGIAFHRGVAGRRARRISRSSHTTCEASVEGEQILFDIGEEITRNVSGDNYTIEQHEIKHLPSLVLVLFLHF